MSKEKKEIKKVQKLSIEESSSLDYYQDNYQDVLKSEEKPVPTPSNNNNNNNNVNSISNKPSDSNIPKIKSVAEEEKERQELYKRKVEEEKRRLSSELEHDYDIFDEEGNLIEKESEASKKIQELKEKLQEQLSLLFDLIKQKLQEPLMKIKASIIKITSKIMIPLTNIFSKVVNLISQKIFKSKNRTQELVEEQKEQVQEIPIEEKYLTASFNDMRDLNIIFTDNYDIPFYKKKKEGAPSFSKIEEEIMMSNAIEAIKQCAEFTLEVPPIQEGIFQGSKVSDIMENVTELEIKLFLGYVKARPQKYTSKAWKISETFATWLVNNSPVAEKK
ncbi:MAG: hypothetical protein KatS3mg068_1407 [Candidatus Sericytochromatia bacterium]|nr:MAG: hypothetical protein KatS3mg068_1407 [Candidatus Sericytochromatia bacterium]